MKLQKHIFTVSTLLAVVITQFAGIKPAFASRLCGIANSTIYYVDVDSTAGSPDGCSWGTAYRNLQDAFADPTLTVGDEIWVAAGTYYPDLGAGQTNDNRNSTFTMEIGVDLYGGFAGTETLLSQRNPSVNVTTLSGDIGTVGDDTDNAYHVVTALNIGTTTIFDGFTIRGGYADGGSDFGGGMYISKSTNALQVTGITFRNNYAGNGGGVATFESNPVFSRVIFSTNSVRQYGGGFYNQDGSPVLIDVVFDNNETQQPASPGGGMHSTNSNAAVYTVVPVLTNVTFSNNRALQGGGGGMFNFESNAILTNVTFSGNSASVRGGAMLNEGSNPILNNVTISGNTAPTGSGGAIRNIYAGAIPSNPVIRNTILWGNGSEEIVNDPGNGVTITDSVIQGGTASVVNNIIVTNPNLGALANNGGFTQTRSIGIGSSALNTGGVVNACAATDQRGVTRPQGGACDIGAFEYSGDQPPMVTTPIADVNVLEDAANTVFSLYPNFQDAETPDNLLTYAVQANTNPGLFTSVNITDPTNFTLDYAPNANGIADITIRVTDSIGQFVDDTFRVTVTAVNDQPDFTAANPPAVNEDAPAQTITGWVTAVDFGPADEDSAQSVLGYIISNNTCGTLLSAGPAVSATGTLTYTPATNQNGTCTFDLQVQDNGGTANSGVDTGPIHTITITVNAVDDASVAVADTATIAEDAAATTVNVRANDTDIDSAVELIQSVTQPANGTVVITNAGADLTYQPNANYCNGGTPTDDFTYTLAGGSSATVAVTVTCVNDASVAVADTATVAEDAAATTVNVRANDTDIDSAIELIQSVTQPANGTVVITNAGADLTYQPNANYCNGGTPTDDFTYTLAGGSTATVAVTVTCMNDASVAVNDTATIAEDAAATTINVRANDTDIDSAVELIQSVTQPANGTVVITNAGADLTYQPDANYCNGGTPTDNFTYTLAGGSTATVAVTVTCVNDASVAVADTATVAEDAAATTINVRANDTDIDSAVELIQSVTQPANGAVVITNAGADLTYQPNANYCNGGTPTDNFTYTLAGGSTATVAVTVTCVNDASVAVNDTATVAEDAAATTINVRANDTDIDSAVELIQSVTQPANGTVVITNAGADLTYQLNANYCNGGTPTDDFTYTLAGGSTATVAVTVTCVNDAPSFTASNPPAVPFNSGAQSIASWATFNPGPNEAGQSVLQYNISGSTCGTLLSAGPSVSAAGTLTYTPALNQSGTCTFDITVQDNGGTANGGVDTSSPAQTFTITVNNGVLVTINKAGGQADPTNASPINFTVVFDAPVNDFATGDVTLSGSAVGVTTTAVVTGGGTTYNVAVSGMVGDGIVTAFIPTGVAHDAGGNPNTDSTSTDNTVTYDTTGPTVTISPAVGQANPTNTSPINFTVVFSEAVSNFATGDVSFAGSTVGGTLTGTVTGGGTTYNVAVTGMTGNGSVAATINAGVATDAVGNGNAVSNTANVTFDTSGPIVTIGAPVPATTTAGPVDFSVSIAGGTTFNLLPANVTLNTTGTATGTVTVTNGNTANPTVTVTGITGSGTIRISIAAGIATDGAGNSSAAAGPSAPVLIDNAGPIVLFNANTVPTDGAILSGGPTQLRVAYNEDVKNDGSAGAANNVANYLLVENGTNLALDTVSCAAGPSANDVQYAINTASYTNNGGSGPFVATLGINGGAPLPVGTYHLFVCGTTSIEDLTNNELNDGVTDTVIDFTVVQATAVVPKTGFAMNTVTTLPAQPEALAYASTDLWMEIPSLGVKMSIVGVPKTSAGWDVTWLDRQAGWLDGSAYPTWKGNSVITAHVWDALNKPGPFARLKELKYGDQVRIHAFGQVYTYEIRETTTISPTNTAAMLKHQDKTWLTLITCEGFQELTRDYSSRRMVRAVLVSVTTEK